MSEYSEKLKDPRWQRKRLEILQRDGWKCKGCRDGDNTLHVHHIFHLPRQEPWDTPNGFLVTLCEECHSPGPCEGHASCEECPEYLDSCEGYGDIPADIRSMIASLLERAWAENQHKDCHSIFGDIYTRLNS